MKMSSRYSNEDILKLLIIYECSKSLLRPCRVFTESYPDKPKVDNSIVRILLSFSLDHFVPKISKDKPLVDNEDTQITSII